jgi:hypothetical protein
MGIRFARLFYIVLCWWLVKKSTSVTKWFGTQYTSIHLGWISYSNSRPTLEICALRPSFFLNLASCFCALHPIYCIFLPDLGALYAMDPTFMKSTPDQHTIDHWELNKSWIHIFIVDIVYGLLMGFTMHYSKWKIKYSKLIRPVFHEFGAGLMF